ncbi:MAG: PQQ-like beta-propeller repeat protein [Planctomycetes bacterium]|nr:PQQ-like beta-propeller repeat protein [Planctomycetota bacterium]
MATDDSFSSPPAAEDPPQKTAAPRYRRLTPPLAVWIVVLACIGAIAYLQRPGVMDHQIANLVSYLLAFIAVMTAAVWFSLFSGHAFLVRMLLLIALLTTPVVFLIIFRVERVSAELVPQFVYRFAPPRDALLEQPDSVESAEEVDLSPTPMDFPRFLGPHGNLSVSGIELARDWEANPPREVWRRPIGAGWSGFSAVNGFAVTMEQRGERELVTCYEVPTGKLRWSHGVEARHETVLGFVGPRSTPTIHDGRVYALGATGVLRCLDGATGEPLWMKNLPAEFGVTVEEDVANVAWGRAGSPLIVDDLVIVPAGGPAGSAVSLVAYDRLTGEEIWRGGKRQISYASPALATLDGVRQIVIVNEDTVSGHDVKTGATLWSHPWEGNSTANATASQAVVMDGDRVFLSKGYGGGSLMLGVSKNGGWATEELWREPSLLKTKLTNVAVKDGYAYGLSDGILECVALDEGERMWKKGRYGHGQILLVGDVLLVQGESGELALVAASPERYQELGRIQALNAQTWNNLCLYDNYLLTRNSEEAACYKLSLLK